MHQTNAFTRLYRIFLISLHTLLGIAIAATIWLLLNKHSHQKLVKWWCAGLLSCFNIQVKTYGTLPSQQTTSGMFLANHISWADIHVLNSIIPLRFIAKSEISNWPIFGYLVKKSGTLFINRSRKKDALRIVDTATQVLLDGDNIGFFPEGTTTDGTSILRFKSSIVQAAINANATLYPVAIRYPLLSSGVNTKIAYAGDTTMGESVMRVLKQKKPTVELHFLAPINTQQGNRQALTQSAYEAIAKQLNL